MALPYELSQTKGKKEHIKYRVSPYSIIFYK